MTVAAGSAAREMHGSELNLSHPSDTFSGTSYSVAHGAMVDVSFQGSATDVSCLEEQAFKLHAAQS